MLGKTGSVAVYLKSYAVDKQFHSFYLAANITAFNLILHVVIKIIEQLTL